MSSEGMKGSEKKRCLRGRGEVRKGGKEKGTEECMEVKKINK